MLPVMNKALARYAYLFKVQVFINFFHTILLKLSLMSVNARITFSPYFHRNLRQ
ncbi:MAG: hypothetical protein ACI808_002073 [Paraglaciecola sp.]|jgi:hypothetical protein